jgi:TolB-like protein
MAGDEVKFGPFRLDFGQRTLSRNDIPVRLGSRALDILCALILAKGNVVTKDALMALVWPNQIVEDNAIQVQVSALRKALDEEASGQSYVMTVPGRGYRFIGLQPPPSSTVKGDNGRSSTVPDSRSIAVLPFQNISSDPEQEYFADGMVADIISGLSRIKWLFVITRNASFVFKGKAIDVRAVGHELGVRYVLEGGVRKSGNRVRITVQLIEVETGIHLWAEHYDRMLDDIFALQDEITMNVIGAIEPSLRRAEIERVRRKRSENLDAYDLVLRAHRQSPREPCGRLRLPRASWLSCPPPSPRSRRQLALDSLHGACPDVEPVRYLADAGTGGLRRGVRKAVGIRRGAISGNMKVSFRAARSIG